MKDSKVKVTFGPGVRVPDVPLPSDSLSGPLPIQHEKQELRETLGHHDLSHWEILS